MSKSNKKIAFFGCKTTTLECMQSLINQGFKIDLLVTLSPELGKKNEVAGYCDLYDFSIKNNIQLIVPKSYSLKKKEDEDILKQHKIDIALVIGWQRLIPEWLLDYISVGAFGMHGSPQPLPRGRGRSPLNWSLLHGKTSLLTTNHSHFSYRPLLSSCERDIGILTLSRKERTGSTGRVGQIFQKLQKMPRISRCRTKPIKNFRKMNDGYPSNNCAIFTSGNWDL